MTLLGQEDLVGLFIDGEVTRGDHTLTRARVSLANLSGQVRHHQVDGLVHGRVIFGLTADDQRGACLVDQDGVHLVDDGVRQCTLHTIGRLVHHVVAQVVKTVFVVGTVGDVTAVGSLLVFAGHLRQVDAHAQTQEVVQTPHPLGVTLSQVIVDGHDVHAVAAQGIQIDRQGGGEGLAFAGAHFGDLALVQGHASHQLHIEVTHAHHPFRPFSHHRKRLGQKFIQRRTLRQPLAEQVGFATQLVV